MPRAASLENPFGAFNFTLESRPASEQIALLEGLGYEGMALYWPGVAAFETFATQPAVREGRFRLFAVLYDFRYDTPWSREEVDAMLAALAPRGTDVWLLLSSTAAPRETMVEAVRELVGMATAQGVRVVVYPHDEHAIETVEEALALLQAVDRPELKASLHLCHELKAGHRDRLAEVIAAAAPQLVLASIHGAAREDTPGWSTTIQPLDRGDLDVLNTYLRPLIRSGYTGPVLLHTFGIEQPPEEHFRRSHAAWREMSREVAATLTGQ
ncbi:sugar phosphate isomerase/epimerase [Archangium gephyra]|uniref:sugar phosphate isomerase/epimerase family protein n=1 Tax=Archangium gephyra TaxID=48 RepID=UPI0035D3F38A